MVIGEWLRTMKGESRWAAPNNDVAALQPNAS